MSYAGATAVAQKYTHYADEITAAAKTGFLDGDEQANIAGILSVLIGAALVFFLFPKLDEDRTLLIGYSQQDMLEISTAGAAPPDTALVPSDI